MCSPISHLLSSNCSEIEMGSSTDNLLGKSLNIILFSLALSTLDALCHFIAFHFLLQGHTSEIISLSFSSTGSEIITGSFDSTVVMWDVRTGR